MICAPSKEEGAVWGDTDDKPCDPFGGQECWESASELWDDTEDWDGRSKDWETPAGDYGVEEWEEIYIAQQERDRELQSLYSAVLHEHEQ
jgi:hypothetical protein